MEQTITNIKSPGLQIILLTGLLAGTMDATGATVSFLLSGGKNPVRIWNYVSSGVFGEQGLTGGASMAALGLLFHYLIATIWAFIFFKVAKYLYNFSSSWVLVGVLYGLIVWMGMNLVVLPLSNTPPAVFSLKKIIVTAVVLIICIGLPISFVAKKYFSKQ